MTTDTYRTFDGSSGGHVAEPAGQPVFDGPEDTSSFDALEALREQVEQRDREAPRTTTVEVPGVGFRLVCSTDVDFRKFSSWQRAALPPKERKAGATPNVLNVDRALLAAKTLIETCEEIEYRHRDGETWETMTDSNGDLVTLKSDALLDRFGVMDRVAFVKRLFRRDPDLISAGDQVAAASGWIESDDEGEPDPTD